MYDPTTAALIRESPKLRDLNVEELPERLTRTFAQLAATRVRLRRGETDTHTINQILGFVRPLALTNEAFVAIAPDRENRRAAAFVAATAHQLVFQALHLVNEASDTSLGRHDISSDIAAILLFLIGRSTADAAEVASRTRFGEKEGIERDLIFAIRCLALGQVRQIIEQNLIAKRHLAAQTQVETATSALYYTLLRGVQTMALRLYNPDFDGPDPVNFFRNVRRLSGLSGHEIASAQDIGQVSAFAGPHHLASLLSSTAEALSDGAVVSILPPTGVDGVQWRTFIQSLATTRPYLWPNHQDAIEQKYLESGVSAAVGLPTGAGKSSISQMKIGSILLSGSQVVFLAPTHALVDQSTQDLKKAFPKAQVKGKLEYDFAEFSEEGLPDILVMTPEACLTLIYFKPDIFENAGLLVFDECHLLHPEDINSRRSIDAMLCVLNFTRLAPGADLLLVSAMMQNTKEIAGWLSTLTQRPALELSLDWKPTRQMRGCLVYEQSVLDNLKGLLERERKVNSSKTVPKVVKQTIKARPYGFFSVKQTWASQRREDYVFLPFLGREVALAVNAGWHITPNSGQVAAELAASAAESGVKTLIFSQSIPNAFAIAKRVSEMLGARKIELTEVQKTLLDTAIDEVGDRNHLFLVVEGYRVSTASTVHHGLLLSEERRLAEALFKQSSGIDVLAATPTLGQGMNLPSEFVIIAEDSRYNQARERRDVLTAQNLLNAAGRAGRAGQNATGIVVVIPGQVVGFNDSESTIGNRWGKLREVFGQSDQCLVIDDPLTAILDRVHAQVDDLGDLERYCITRLAQPSAQADENVAPEVALKMALGRSFWAYRKQILGEQAWVDSRIASALSYLGDQELLSEIEKRARQIASTTGMPEDIIAKLSVDLQTNSLVSNASVVEWCNWLLRWIERQPQFLPRIVKPDDLSNQFGSPYKNLETEDERTAYAMPYLKKMLARWMAGHTLIKIQEVLPHNSKEVKKCTGARKFVVRIVPSLAHFFSLPALILDGNIIMKGSPRDDMQPAILVLNRCVRHGYNSAELEALHEQYSPIRYPRRKMHRLFSSLQPYLAPATDRENWKEVLSRVETAMIHELNDRSLNAN